MTEKIDIAALRVSLAEYDPDAPRCTKKVTERRSYAPDYMRDDDPEWNNYQVTHYLPCCRPMDHPGECRNSRKILGWPGFKTLNALLDELEESRKMREAWVLSNGTSLLGSEDSEVMLFYSKLEAFTYRDKMGAVGFNPTKTFIKLP